MKNYEDYIKNIRGAAVPAPDFADMRTQITSGLRGQEAGRFRLRAAAAAAFAVILIAASAYLGIGGFPAAGQDPVYQYVFQQEGLSDGAVMDYVFQN